MRIVWKDSKPAKRKTKVKSEKKDDKKKIS